MKPWVSVILPVYNEGKYIRQCLESILSQEKVPVEVCISDNVSEDSTWEIVTSIAASHPNVRAVRQEKKLHPYRNIREAARLATGQYMFYMGGDDYLLPGIFDYAFEKFCNEKSTGALVIRMNYFDDQTGDVFATVPPDGFGSELKRGREPLLRFILNNINHDELVCGIFESRIFLRALDIIRASSVESVGIWMFLAAALSMDSSACQIAISDRPYLMKRYGKPSAQESNYAKSALKIEKAESLVGRVETFLQLEKMSGSIANVISLKKELLINSREARSLLLSPRYHSDYGLCHLGPVFHPVWRVWRGFLRVVSGLKRRLLPVSSR